MRSYITTAIDFPNGAPHMGHVMEKVMADVYARWCRLRGDQVRFQIGTDDHGIKLQRTAESQGMHPRDLVLQNIPKFTSLFEALHISHDVFVSTSVTEGHYQTAQALWNVLVERGYLYQKEYTGLYCAGCEEFKSERDLVDGLCPNHQKAPEQVSETNWFFKLEEFSDWLAELLDSKGYQVVPEFRSKEVRAILEQGLHDVSFSRPKSTLYWGVPVPNDPEQVMYVWCDNLTNYISSLGNGDCPTLLCGPATRSSAISGDTDSSNQSSEGHPSPSEVWWDDAEVTHVVGKDITRFHGLNWPAMLKAADIKTPDRLLVHGFLTANGQKMSKSTGNVVEPLEVLEHVKGNPDPLRFYLSHEIPVGNDGDFSWERFDALYNSALRNNLGNLLNRVLVMLKKEGGQLGALNDFDFTETWKHYTEHMNQFDFKAAIEQAMAFATEGNQSMETQKPWTLEGEAKLECLTAITEFLRHSALMLLPFMPHTAQQISLQLGVPYAEHMLSKDFTITEQMKQWGGIKEWRQIGEPEILFEPLE